DVKSATPLIGSDLGADLDRTRDSRHPCPPGWIMVGGTPENPICACPPGTHPEGQLCVLDEPGKWYLTVPIACCCVPEEVKVITHPFKWYDDGTKYYGHIEIRLAWHWEVIYVPNLSS